MEDNPKGWYLEITRNHAFARSQNCGRSVGSQVTCFNQFCIGMCRVVTGHQFYAMLCIYVEAEPCSLVPVSLCKFLTVFDNVYEFHLICSKCLEIALGARLTTNKERVD